MKEIPFASLIVLAGIAASANFNHYSQYNTTFAEQSAEACVKYENSTDSSTGGGWGAGGGPKVPLDVGCEDCELSQVIVQFYCQSQGTDCDGFPGINESYEWSREKHLYQCGTPGTPAYGWYIACTYWTQEECCNEGSSALPPTNCSYTGAAKCATRVVP